MIDPIFVAAVVTGFLVLVMFGLQILITLKFTQRESLRDRAFLALEGNFRALCVGANGLGEHLHKLECQIRRVAERQDQVEVTEPDQAPVRQAISLIEKGASIDDLITACGFSQGEAELIAHLHGLGQVHGAGGAMPVNN